MKKINKYTTSFMLALLLIIGACSDVLDELPENESLTGDTDYTISDNMILPVLGAYEGLYTRGWEEGLLLGVRGDDVNAGGLGDQQPFWDTDAFKYDKNYWMYNSVWQLHYNDIIRATTAIGEIEKYRDNGGPDALADQYVAECKTIIAYLYLNLAQTFGDVIVIGSLDAIAATPVSTRSDVMQHIVDEMAEAIPLLPPVNPNKRTDIKGGVTRFTALAVQAMANQELENYQGVADATSQIISSGEYRLEPDFYGLFKLNGKLNDENILELQYSDFGQGTGPSEFHLFAPYGPQSWTPAVTGKNGGWGFYEPSEKYIKFMLDRGEQVRLETSVIFTPDGMAQIESDPNYAPLPAWLSNTTRDGDRFNNAARANFHSGKHYLPSNQLTDGRNGYGNNKNYTVIRYAEILLMHAEALTRGASSSAMTADDAVNAVRSRAGLGTLGGVTTEQVLDEKYAELAMEWGKRFHDMLRTGNAAALSYDGRTFTMDLARLPYPQAQLDELKQLDGGAI